MLETAPLDMAIAHAHVAAGRKPAIHVGGGKGLVDRDIGIVGMRQAGPGAAFHDAETIGLGLGDGATGGQDAGGGVDGIDAAVDDEGLAVEFLIDVGGVFVLAVLVGLDAGEGLGVSDDAENGVVVVFHIGIVPKGEIIGIGKDVCGAGVIPDFIRRAAMGQVVAAEIAQVPRLISALVVREEVVVLMGVHGHGEKLLAFVVFAVGQDGLVFGLGEGGQEERRQYGNDRDDNQQFDEGEAFERNAFGMRRETAGRL